MTRLAFGLFAILATVGFGAAAQAQGGASPDAPATSDEPPPEGSSKPVAPAGAAEAAEAPRRPAWDDVVVVPRKGFLKGGRLELAPFSAVTLNDVLIRHYAVGGDLNYYLTDVFSIGLEGQYFVKELSERESLVGLQYNRVPTLNRYKYSAAFNFGYVPGYGKFTLFNKYIWHWDIFVNGGVGVIWSQIIPRIVGDQVFQTMSIAPDVGVGTRLFLNDWLTLSFAIRDYIFNDKFEPLDRKRGEAIEDVKARAQGELVNNVMFAVSLGFYLPTSFQYRTPR